MTSPLTLEQVRTEPTLEEVTDDFLTQLDALGFSATSWQTGSVARTISVTCAYTAYSLRRFVSALSYQGYNSDASQSMLTKFSASHYDNARVEATSTIGTVVLTGGSSGPPHTISAGEIVVSDGTYTFRNTTGGTVPASGTLSITVEAETAGSDSNVANGTITTMVTPLAGVSCNNPDPGSGTWITTLGADEETDAALRLRNSSKWSSLSTVEAISDRYEYIARTVVSNARVKVDDSNPSGPGTLTVYLAAEDGVASGAQVTLVDNAIDAAHFGGTHTTTASSSDTLTITATVYYDSSYTSGAIQAAVEAAITAYVNGAPIGGYDFSPGPDEVIDRDGLLSAIRGVTGVRKVAMSVPAADFSLSSAYHVAIEGSHSITYTAVT